MIAAGAVVWKLKSVNAITAIVGQRIYPGRAPQNTPLPYIVVDRPPGQQNLGQTSQGSGKFRKSPVVVYCFADKDSGGITQAETIRALVEPALAPSSGVVGTVTWNSISIDHVTVNDALSLIHI